MKRWIPGWELCERWIPWDISYYDIVDIIVNGELTAYNLNQTPVDVDIEKQTREEIEFLKSKIGLMGLALGGNDPNSYRKDVKEELIRSITLGLDGFLFKITEVEEYERTHGLIPQRNQAESADPSALSRIGRRTAWQKDKEEANKIANKYIAECESKGETPHIYKAVKLIEGSGKLSREYKGKHTIHDWIKGPFPEESKKQGQGRPKNE